MEPWQRLRSPYADNNPYASGGLFTCWQWWTTSSSASLPGKQLVPTQRTQLTYKRPYELVLLGLPGFCWWPSDPSWWGDPSSEAFLACPEDCFAIIHHRSSYSGSGGQPSRRAYYWCIFHDHKAGLGDGWSTSKRGRRREAGVTAHIGKISHHWFLMHVHEALHEAHEESPTIKFLLNLLDDIRGPGEEESVDRLINSIVNQRTKTIISRKKRM